MILGLESSCDESALALFCPWTGWKGEWISSQVKLHADYGGVVPELAAREHLANLPILLSHAKASASWKHVSGVAVTVGPGLPPCLALGLAAGRALQIRHGIPLVGINHLRAHAWSPFLPLQAKDPAGYPSLLASLLPHLGLLASGGNTILFRIELDQTLSVLGETVDDAAGEALDKGAKLLGLGYPGGPEIETWARQGSASRFAFPRGRVRENPSAFTFSGLKTSLRYRLEAMTADEAILERANLCASYQEAVVEALVQKVTTALERHSYRSVGLSGGVANNERLRQRLLDDCTNWPVLFAERRHTGDNAAMVAFCAWHEYGKALDWPSSPANIHPAWRLTDRC